MSDNNYSGYLIYIHYNSVPEIRPSLDCCGTSSIRFYWRDKNDCLISLTRIVEYFRWRREIELGIDPPKYPKPEWFDELNGRDGIAIISGSNEINLTTRDYDTKIFSITAVSVTYVKFTGNIKDNHLTYICEDNN